MQHYPLSKQRLDVERHLHVGGVHPFVLHDYCVEFQIGHLVLFKRRCKNKPFLKTKALFVCFRKRAPLADALVVAARIMADDMRFIHLNAEMLLYEIDGGKDGEVGVAFAAARSADVADRPERLCRHPVRQRE